jgi:putative membrane protein insertion efficiency factor
MKKLIFAAAFALSLCGSLFAYWDCEWDTPVPVDPYCSDSLNGALTGETSSIKIAALAWLRFYQLTLSGNTGGKCAFYPNCSRYGFFCVKKYGALKGILMSAERVSRCNPWVAGYGIDDNSGLFYDPPEAENTFNVVFDGLNF